MLLILVKAFLLAVSLVLIALSSIINGLHFFLVLPGGLKTHRRGFGEVHLFHITSKSSPEAFQKRYKIASRYKNTASL